MPSKILLCLVAVLLVTLGGAFAAPPERSTAPSAPAVAQPMPVEDFVQGLGDLDPSQPINQVVVSCSLTCTSNLQCLSKCGPAFCGGTCKVVSACGSRKVCDCLYCP